MSEFINFPMVSQPKRIKTSLFKHQLTSIYNMEKIETEKRINISNMENISTRVGILSDLTGYGKTLSILGLIDRDKMTVDESFITENYTGNNLIFRKKINLYETIKSNLIVVNPSLYVQWETELSKTSLKVGYVNTKKHVDDIQPDEYDITLCNSNMVQFLTSRFRKYCWKRLIIDEPLTFKMTDYNNFSFYFTWLITATPFELINNKKGTNHIFQELFSGDEDLLKSVIIRNPDEYVKESFNMPENVHIHHKSYHPITKLLSGLVSPVVYEMILAGNIKEAIKFLGGDYKTGGSLYHILKEKKLDKIKEINLQLSITDVKENKIKLLEKKRVVEEQIQNLEKRLDESLREGCIICDEQLSQPVFLPCCQNLMCGNCILTWLQSHKTCPLCRGEIDSKDLIMVVNKIEEEKKIDSEKKRTKPQIILELITEKKDNRFIIFSNYDESFYSVQNLLDENNIKWIELKGNKDIRNKNIQTYKSGEVQVLFLNSKSNSAGLNLEETTDIILYHPMTEHCEIQILGRANRIGRAQKLFVHHLE